MIELRMLILYMPAKSSDAGVGSILTSTFGALLLPIPQLGKQSIYTRDHDDMVTMMNQLIYADITLYDETVNSLDRIIDR